MRARSGSEVLALKIRRTDANRPDMEQEARITGLVNRVGVGVQVRAHSRDMILMKLLQYQELQDWLGGLSGPGTRRAAREMIHSVLNQCRKLDVIGVDHGQLSNLRKHIVVAEGRPWVIDFESAGTARRPKNVTTAAQYLFVGGRASPLVRRVLGIKDTGPILKLLSDYKHDTSDFTFAKLLELLRLSPR
ncbi:MAG TPA: hypothetical protein VEC02_04115 [Nitrososphaerales archaeon]|nr:hypothetical protein [Nitrososphaerales archaeon]